MNDEASRIYRYFFVSRDFKKGSLHYHELLMRMKITVVYFSHAAFFLQIFPENL